MNRQQALELRDQVKSDFPLLDVRAYETLKHSHAVECIHGNKTVILTCPGDYDRMLASYHMLSQANLAALLIGVGRK